MTISASEVKIRGDRVATSFIMIDTWSHSDVY